MLPLFFFSPKMAKSKVYFDYEHDYHRTKLFCIASTVLIVLFPVIGAVANIEFGGKNISIFEIIYVCGFISFQISTHTIQGLLYTILLKNLQKRYEALNSLLRYGSKIRSFHPQFSFKFFASYRDRLMEMITLFSDQNRIQSIRLIKFVGQQHCRLTNIMELNNFCHAIQV